MLLTDADIESTLHGYDITAKQNYVMELHVDHTVLVSAVIPHGVYTLSRIAVDNETSTVSFYTDTRVSILTVAGKAGTQTIIDDVVISVNGT